MDGFILDSPSSLDSKKVWVYYVHTHSFLAKCILVHVSYMHLSEMPRTNYTLAFRANYVISLTPGIFKNKKIDLLAKTLGSWSFVAFLIVCLFARCCEHVCACFFLFYFENIKEFLCGNILLFPPFFLVVFGLS